MGPEILFVGAIIAAVGALSASRQGQRELAVTWSRGHAALAAGRLDEAEECFRSTLTQAERRFGPDHWRTSLHVSALAQTMVAQRRVDEAAPLVDRALGIVDRWSPVPHDDVVLVVLGAASFESARGRHSRATSLIERARRLARHSSTWQAHVERTVATLEARAGHHEQAADAMTGVPLEQLERSDLKLLASLGIAHRRTGDGARAARCFGAAHALVERLSTGEFAEAFFRGLHAEALAHCGRDREALQAMDQAVIDYDAVLGERHPATAALLVELAELRLRLGDAAGARVACERVLAIPIITPAAASDEPYRASAASGDPLGPERGRARSLLARARRG